MFVSFPSYPSSSVISEGDVVRRMKKDYSGNYATVYMLVTDVTYVGDSDDDRLVSFSELTVSSAYGSMSYSLTNRTLSAQHEDMLTLVGADAVQAQDALAFAQNQESIAVAEAHVAWTRAASRLEAVNSLAARVL